MESSADWKARDAMAWAHTGRLPVGVEDTPFLRFVRSLECVVCYTPATVEATPCCGTPVCPLCMLVWSFTKSACPMCSNEDKYSAAAAHVRAAHPQVTAVRTASAGSVPALYVDDEPEVCEKCGVRVPADETTNDAGLCASCVDANQARFGGVPDRVERLRRRSAEAAASPDSKRPRMDANDAEVAVPGGGAQDNVVHRSTEAAA